MIRLVAAFLTATAFATLLGSTSVSSQAIDKEKLWETTKDAVVKIRAFGKGADGSAKAIDAGTGVFISASGYILTALHVVGRDDEWQAVGPQQRPDRHVEVIALDQRGVPQTISQNAAVHAIPGVDLALLRVDGSCFPHADLSDQRPKGFPTLVVIAWGTDGVPHPTSTDLTVTQVNQYGDNLTIDRISVVGGYSGSPLLDASGRVVGIVTLKLGDGGAIAVPSTAAFKLLPFDPIAQRGQPFPNSCYASCPHPDHGVTGWRNQRSWDADSGWRGGGFNPDAFCAQEKASYERANPGHQVTYATKPEDHRVTYNPFKHDEYRYFCTLTERWDPIYRTSQSPACGLAPTSVQ